MHPQSKTAPPPATQEEPPYPRPLVAWYAVAVLTLVYIFSFIDRQILSLLVKPIRAHLGIGDTQMGLLIGTSFAIFYTFFGIPLGRLADLRSRRGIIAGGFFAWSLFTSACALAKNFAQMLLYRIGVGVGEAALSPAAYSLITDSFPKERLATALSVYSMGIYIGSGMAFLLGGQVVRLATSRDAWTVPLIGAVQPWQVIFLIVGLPGVLLALLLFTIREPVRRGLARQASTLPAKEVFAYIFRNTRTFLCHNIGFGMISLAAYASAAWVPEFFRRVHQWSIPQTGTVYGILVMTMGPLGLIVAGRVADHLRARGVRDANMKVGIWIALLSIPVHFGVYLAPSGTIAAIWLAPACMLAAAPWGIAPAAIQQMMPNPMRGQASAVYLFLLNLVGLGIGPTAVAWVTEHVFGREDAVNYSLLLVSVTASIISATLLWIGLRHYLRSLDRLKAWAA
ncbi:MAG: MFS transporter [Acidobacteriota bacterium]|nr:MFS transporter [Acidobacteriota bacterium]